MLIKPQHRSGTSSFPLKMIASSLPCYFWLVVPMTTEQLPKETLLTVPEISEFAPSPISSFFLMTKRDICGPNDVGTRAGRRRLDASKHRQKEGLFWVRCQKHVWEVKKWERVHHSGCAALKKKAKKGTLWSWENLRKPSSVILFHRCVRKKSKLCHVRREMDIKKIQRCEFTVIKPNRWIRSLQMYRDAEFFL